jgi:predicted GNAT superfamily acetyltransferase
MKITNVKAMVAKGVTVGLLAGAFVLAAPAKADAQQVAVGVQVGYPQGGYARRDYYSHLRFEQERRHEGWVRAHEFDRRHDGYRGRR